MDRYNFEEHISAYLDNELSDPDRKIFEEILSSHPSCNKKFEEVKRMVLNLNELPNLETSNDFIPNLNKRIDQEINQESSFLAQIKDTFFLRPNMGFAMSFAALFLISYIFIENFNSTDYYSSEDSDGVHSDKYEEIYLSDVDSTDQDDEYEGDILQTSGQE